MRLKGLWNAIAHASAKADGILAEHAASAFGDTSPDGSSGEKSAPVPGASGHAGGSAASTKGSAPNSPSKASTRSPERAGEAAAAPPAKKNKGLLGRFWLGRGKQLFLGLSSLPKRKRVSRLLQYLLKSRGRGKPLPLTTRPGLSRLTQGMLGLQCPSCLKPRCNWRSVGVSHSVKQLVFEFVQSRGEASPTRFGARFGSE